MNKISFSEAINLSSTCTKRHLLLGNGFSVACLKDKFSYKSLFDGIDVTKYPRIANAFDILQSVDFEIVIDALNTTSKILPIYDLNPERICKVLHKDAERIKDLLINAISQKHPAFPDILSETIYTNCIKFLINFINDSNNSGKIFTLNYDLLLYWTFMRIIEKKDSKLIFSDGFGRDTYADDGEIIISDELTWQKNPYQNIYYLHGALHLYDNGYEIQKICWKDNNVSIIDQTRALLATGRLPLFVSEGNSEMKLKNIIHNNYLSSCYNTFRDVANCGMQKKCNTSLFTYGVSFSDNDYHIFDLIAKGKIKYLFVSIFGDVKAPNNKQVLKTMKYIQSQRDKTNPIEIHLYDAASANVWG